MRDTRPWNRRKYRKNWKFVVASFNKPFTIHAIRTVNYRDYPAHDSVRTMCGQPVYVFASQVIRFELLGSDVGVPCGRCWKFLEGQ